MPNLDELEAPQRLRALGFDVDDLPFVALTADANSDDVAACQTEIIQTHLAKRV